MNNISRSVTLTDFVETSDFMSLTNRSLQINSITHVPIYNLYCIA